MEGAMRRERSRNGAVLIGGLAASVLHVGLLAPLFGVDGRDSEPPLIGGEGATRIVSSVPAGASLILIDIISIDPARSAPVVLPASEGVTSASALLHVAAADATPPTPLRADASRREREPRTVPLSLPEAAERAALRGRYEGQIRARVEKAWERPRAGLDDAVFRCTVAVTQDKQGFVLEVELVDCDNSPQWQVSLIVALQAASPLPAPPDPAVFSERLQLEFTAPAFLAGVPTAAYEPAAQDSSSTPPSPPSPSSASGPVDLLIKGTNVTWNTESTP
jgi:hypothetical protein